VADDQPGGFQALYPVLVAMEEAGKARRGHFVDGLGGAQFASPGAVDRLRACRQASSGTVVLAAVDPANPYGAALSWPPAAELPRRLAGATVALQDGRPVLFLDGGGRRLLTFGCGAEDLARAATSLRTAMGSRGCRIGTIDGVAALDSPATAALERAGFAADHRGHLR
jgi:ATP-dependent Lhr-like helicase